MPLPQIQPIQFPDFGSNLVKLGEMKRQRKSQDLEDKLAEAKLGEIDSQRAAAKEIDDFFKAHPGKITEETLAAMENSGSIVLMNQAKALRGDMQKTETADLQNKTAQIGNREKELKLFKSFADVMNNLADSPEQAQQIWPSIRQQMMGLDSSGAQLPEDVNQAMPFLRALHEKTPQELDIMVKEWERANPPAESFFAPTDTTIEGKPAVIQAGNRGTVKQIPNATPYEKPPASKLLSPEEEAQRIRIAQESRPPAAPPAPRAPVAVMGPDGKPVLVRPEDSYGRTPANTREQGRPVTSGDANRVSDMDNGLNEIKTLRGAIPEGATGTLAKIETKIPNALDPFGWTNDAKQKQATIDRVKQVIGKTLEGGVLRKEDEYKYEKILPTIYDKAPVVKTKLDGLEQAIRDKRGILLDSLEDANYDVSKYRQRGSVNPSGGSRPPLSSFEH